MNDRSPSQNSSRPQDDWDAQDSQIQRALQQLSPPTGARERARMRLRAEIDASQAQPAGVQGATLTIAETINAETIGAETIRIPPTLTRPENGRLPKVTRRRLLGLATAAAASGIALGYWQTRPVSREQLAQICVDALNDLMESPPQWKLGDEASYASVAPVLELLRQPPAQLGFANLAPHALAKRSVVSKFGLANGKSLYVFQWRSSRQVDQLSSRLQIIQQSSGGWSLAAMQSSEQILVAAVAGEIAPYFRSVPLA